MTGLSSHERSLIIARLARGKSKLTWRACEEEAAIDKLMALLDGESLQPEAPVQAPELVATHG